MMTVRVWMTLLCTLFALFASVASAPILARDVFVPPVLLPNADSVWPVGSTQTVAWDTSDAPDRITNKFGQVVLSKDGILLLDTPLVKGFDIMDSRVTIEVPDVDPGVYSVVLFGDSGNHSPEFVITS